MLQNVFLLIFPVMHHHVKTADGDNMTNIKCYFDIDINLKYDFFVCGPNPQHKLSFSSIKPNCTALWLHGLQRSTLHKKTFRKMANLRVLVIDRNSITRLPSVDLFQFTCIETLNITNNKITALSRWIFSSMVKLTHLSLLGNLLSSLPAGIFKLLEPFTLVFAHNRLFKLPGKLFHKCQLYNSLSFSHNYLLALPELLFPASNRLKLLDASHNQLSNLPETIFFNLTRLKTLDLSSNFISFLPVEIFFAQNCLQKLYLQDNMLTSISWELFVGLRKIQEIYLARNNISIVDNSAFPDLCQNAGDLRVLSLLDNSISGSNWNVFDYSNGSFVKSKQWSMFEACLRNLKEFSLSCEERTCWVVDEWIFRRLPLCLSPQCPRCFQKVQDHCASSFSGG